MLLIIKHFIHVEWIIISQFKVPSSSSFEVESSRIIPQFITSSNSSEISISAG